MSAIEFYESRLGEEPKTASEKLTVVMMTEYAESLRAERDGLVEALKQIEQFSDVGDDLIAVVRMKRIASTTLAKYEK